MIAFLVRRFGWMFIGAAGKELARRVSERQVEEARSDLAERLPDRAVAIADKLPGDLLKAAGTAQVAGRVAGKSARISKDVATRSRDLAGSPQKARQRLSEMGEEWQAQVADDELSLRARLINQTRGRTAADDVLMGGQTSWEDEPLPEVADRIDGGRPVRRAKNALVDRVQRSYRPRKHGWQ